MTDKLRDEHLRHHAELTQGAHTPKVFDVVQGRAIARRDAGELPVPEGHGFMRPVNDESARAQVTREERTNEPKFSRSISPGGKRP